MGGQSRNLQRQPVSKHGKTGCLFGYAATLAILYMYKPIMHHGLANNKGCDTRSKTWVSDAYISL